MWLPDARSYYDIGPGRDSRWDIDTGQLLATVPTGHACWQSWLIAGGTQLVTRASDTNSNAMTVEVWDLQRGTRLLSQGARTVGPSCAGRLAGRLRMGGEDCCHGHENRHHECVPDGHDSLRSVPYLLRGSRVFSTGWTAFGRLHVAERGRFAGPGFLRNPRAHSKRTRIQ